MMKTYLVFWTKYRNVLLDGKMFYKNYAADHTCCEEIEPGTPARIPMPVNGYAYLTKRI